MASKPKSQPPVEGNPQLRPSPSFRPHQNRTVFWNRDWQGNPKYTQQICGCFCYSYFLDHTFVIHGPGDSRQTHIHQSILTPPESPGEFQNPKSLGRVTQQSLKKYRKNLHALANTWNASQVGQHFTQTHFVGQTNCPFITSMVVSGSLNRWWVIYNHPTIPLFFWPLGGLYATYVSHRLSGNQISNHWSPDLIISTSDESKMHMFVSKVGEARAASEPRLCSRHIKPQVVGRWGEHLPMFQIRMGYGTKKTNS